MTVQELAEYLKNGDVTLVDIRSVEMTVFETTLETTERLAAMAPDDRILVSESGIFTPADVARVKAAGARAILVGESLMRQDDPGEAAKVLLGRS